MLDSDVQARARVGDVLNDKWTLERLLGAGGMGAVYAGRHRNGARAAVKVLHRYLSQYADVRARFLREGYAANRVDRPGVVKVLDDDIVVGGPDDGTAYLVMEMLEGESLESRVVGGKTVTEREFLYLADAVLDVLDGAHTNGVIHRDIKPDNLFITRDESGVVRIKVLDFGLARLLEGRSTTTHGLALGTPSFMSPEQAAGRNAEIDGRTDLFALAASGFRVVAGRKIHIGVSPIDLMSKMSSLPAPPLRSVAPHVSEPFAHIIDKALQFKREDRYETAAAMRVDVQRALAAHAAGDGPTMLPVPSSEKSIELSAADFEKTAFPRLSEDPPTDRDAPEIPLSRIPEPSAGPAIVAPPPTVREGAGAKSEGGATGSGALLTVREGSSKPIVPAAVPDTPSSPKPVGPATVREGMQVTPALPGEYGEGSLAPIPMQRSLVVRAFVILVVGLGVGVAYAAFNPDTSTSPSTSPPVVSVASDAAVGRGDAAVAEHDAAARGRAYEYPRSDPAGGRRRGASQGARRPSRGPFIRAPEPEHRTSEAEAPEALTTLAPRPSGRATGRSLLPGLRTSPGWSATCAPREPRRARDGRTSRSSGESCRSRCVRRRRRALPGPPRRQSRAARAQRGRAARTPLRAPASRCW